MEGWGTGEQPDSSFHFSRIAGSLREGGGGGAEGGRGAPPSAEVQRQARGDERGGGVRGWVKEVP